MSPARPLAAVRSLLRKASSTTLRRGKNVAVSAGEMRKRGPSGPTSVNSLLCTKPDESEGGQTRPPPRLAPLLR